ncbi:MAG TPA: hypothetical protein V6C85_04895 [Allocoleopsis sp.]
MSVWLSIGISLATLFCSIALLQLLRIVLQKLWQGLDRLVMDALDECPGDKLSQKHNLNNQVFPDIVETRLLETAHHSI